MQLAEIRREIVVTTLTFASRFQQLKGRASFQALSDAVYRATGIRITAQAMHKWTEGGNINRANARVLADFFGVTEAWLLYGVGREHEVLLEDALRDLERGAARQVLDYIRYHLERHSRQLTADKMQTYIGLLERLQSELEEPRRPTRRGAA